MEAYCALNKLCSVNTADKGLLLRILMSGVTIRNISRPVRTNKPEEALREKRGHRNMFPFWRVLRVTAVTQSRSLCQTYWLFQWRYVTSFLLFKKKKLNHLKKLNISSHFQLEIDSKHFKTLFRPNTICLWAESGWLSGCRFHLLLIYSCSYESRRKQVSQSEQESLTNFCTFKTS